MARIEGARRQMRCICPFCAKEITPDEIQCFSCGTTYSFETLLNIRSIAKQAKLEDPSEGRRCPRFRRKFSVIYTCSKGLRKRHLSDISRGGVFIKSNNPLHPGEKINLKILLSDGEKELEVAGQVTWTSNEKRQTPMGELPPGMGIKFLDLSPADAERIHAALMEPPSQGTKG
jgi:uncharacterized protein (TIGR02266 family)